MEPQQMEPLLALESDLRASLEATQSANEEMLAQMDTSRRTIHQLLHNEAVETALYVEDTQLQMRALRDVMALEMDRARRDVDALVKEAERNVTREREARDRTRAATRAKLVALQRRRREREVEWAHEIQRVKAAAAQAAAQIQAQGWEDETVPRRHSHQQLQPAETEQSTLAIRADDPVWVLPFVVGLVLCAGLYMLLSAWRARRNAAARRRRVLYSEQLTSHFARKDDASGPDKSVGDRPESPRSPASFDRRQPTLQRRLRPSWSPAASTASTVSPRDAPLSSVFSGHDAFTSAMPF
jgi:hypothetical protein